MAQHKRHHYVPRCYLRAFSVSARGRAINVYNISGDIAIPNAPVKGQCARDYFYGDATDLRLEKALQYIEGAYARAIRKIQSNGDSIDNDDVMLLRDFAFLQWLRTDIAIKRMKLLHEEFERVTYERDPGARPRSDFSDRNLILVAMRNYTNLRKFIQDLKGVIVVNHSGDDFITSDDPAFFTNRFHIQKIRSKSSNFGLASSGALFFLPLTPRHQFLCYDGGAYVVPEKRGFCVSTGRSADIKALNELQYLKAAENLYFSSWRDRERIQDEFHKASEHRPKSWHEIDVFVHDRLTEGREYYVRATKEERSMATKTIQVMSSRYAEPLHWVSMLHHRSAPRVYCDGSAIGYVRKREWLARGA
jgi:hypothetical protein